MKIVKLPKEIKLLYIVDKLQLIFFILIWKLLIIFECGQFVVGRCQFDENVNAIERDVFGGEVLYSCLDP